MAPAPVRAPRGRTRGAWGVPVGATLMVVGVVTGIVIVALGVISFAVDVDRLARTDSGGELVADLEAGKYFLYDEDDGFDLGPLDVRITRVSDGLTVAPSDVEDGPSYDIGANRGSAALSFDLPSAGDYRIEATTGVGEIVSFAVGRDVGSGPLGSLVRGLVIGGVLFVVGLVLLIWGVVQRGRARLRSRAAEAIEQSRRAVESSAGAIDDPDRRRHVATHHGRRASQTVTERATAAPAPLRAEVEDVTGRIEGAVGDLAASTEAPSQLMGRLGDSLGRAQERLAAGDSLRDVARDGSGELRALGNDARVEATGAYGAARGAASEARPDVEAQRSDLETRRDHMVAAAGDEADRSLGAAERIAEQTGAEIGVALDNAASDLTAAALRQAGAVNEEAKAAIDAASAQLRAASSIPPPAPMPSPGAQPPPPPPPPPPAPAVTAPERARDPEIVHGRVADIGGPVPLAPPPTERIPVGSRSVGPDRGSLVDTALAAAETGGGEPNVRSSPAFAALAPPPRALTASSLAAAAADATADLAATAGSDQPVSLAAPVLAPPPSGRRPDASSSPGPGVSRG